MTASPEPSWGSFSRSDDLRGTWSRVFDAQIQTHFRVAQSSVSRSPVRGTLRGLHSLAPESCEWKLVACVAGEVWDLSSMSIPAGRISVISSLPLSRGSTGIGF